MFKKTVICALVVALLAVFAVVPVSAASDTWTETVFNSYEEHLSYWGHLNALQGQRSPNGGGMEWQLPADGKWVGNNVEFFVRAKMDVPLKNGDRFIIEDKTIYGWFGGTENTIISVRYFLGYHEYNDKGEPYVTGAVAAGKYTTYNVEGGKSYGITVKGEDFHITANYDHVWVGIMFRVSRVAGQTNTFSLNYFNYHYGYGNRIEQDKADGAVGDVLGSLPANPTGFANAFQSFVQPMTYTGTDAKWSLPDIKLPAISGVMEGVTLTKNLEVDFGGWFQKMPPNVLEVVQILFTLALVVFCAKELYGLISYVFTMKGGGASE